MTTPTLELHLKASGVREVKDLTAALAMLNGEVGRLKEAKKGLSALSEITAQMQELRRDLKQGFSELKQVLTEGVKASFAAAAKEVSSSSKGLRKAFDEQMRDISKSIADRNAEIAKTLTAANAGVAKSANEAGRQTAQQYSKGLQEGLAKVRLSMSVPLPGGARAGVSVGGLDNLGTLLSEAEKVKQSKAGRQAADEFQKAYIAKLREKSALAVPVETLLGLPSRDEMKRTGAQIAAQMRDGVALENMRAKSANAADPRTLLGLPSRDEMKSFGAQIAAQLRDGVATENLRARSAGRVDAQTLLGLPSRDEMKTMGAQIAAQMREGVATENLRARSAGRVDARALLGLPSRDEMKVMGSQIAAQMREGVQLESLRAKSAGKIDPRTLLGLPSQSEMASFTNSLRAQMQETERIRASVSNATRTAGPYSSLATREVVGDLDSLTRRAPLSAAALRLFTNQMNDAHSAARGLASGFGALWLTWGAMVPLLAGAAVSNAFVQTIKMGAEVQNTFKQIEVLAGSSSEEVRILNGHMLNMAQNGVFGPLELAKAMKTLALAGLDAGKVYAALPDVLNFAVAGDTSIEKAADVMTTVATAFNVSAQNYAYVGDTIAKAAAESKSSVESMGEAFKTASVIHQQYGVSLEDTAVGLSLLANAGIQGTAAGTALRNMYADLAGRTPKVQKALDELRVQTIDPLTGKLREQSAVFSDLMQALATKTPTAQFKYLQDIFSERGGKEAIAIMNAMRKAAEESGKGVANAYEELQQKIVDAAGFTATAAAQMSLTPLNQMKSVAATLQAVLVETFESLQPVVLDVSNNLKAIFKSEEFRGALASLVTGVANLTVLLVEHGDKVASVVLTYMGFKAVVGVLTALSAATAAWSATTTAAVGAVGFATRAAMVMNPLLSALVGLVTAGAAAWGIYAINVGSAADKQKNLGTDNAKSLLERLEQEEKRLRDVNEARRQGISLMELEAKTALEKARTEMPKELVSAKNALSSFDAETARLRGAAGDPANWNQRLIQGFAARDRERLRLTQAVTAAEAQHGEVLLKTQRTVSNIVALQKEAAAAERKRMKDEAAAIKSGVDGRPVTAKGFNTGAPPADNTLAVIETNFRRREEVENTFYENRRKVLEAQHRAGLVSEGQYQAELLAQTQAYEARELTLIQEQTQEYLRQYRERASELAKIVDPKRREQALENLSNKKDQFLESQDNQIRVLRDNALTRQKTATIALEGETRKLLKTEDEYWKKADDKIKKDAAVTAARLKYAGASEEVRVRAEAEARVDEQVADHLEALQQQYRKTESDLANFVITMSSFGPPTEESSRVIASMTDRLLKLGSAAEKAGERVKDMKKAAGDAAVFNLEAERYEKARKEVEGLSKTVTEKLVDGIMSGGKEGFKGLKDWAKNYFIREPIKVVLQAVLSPVGNMVGNVVSNFLGLGSFGGGSSPAVAGNGLLSMLGTGSSIANIFHSGGWVNSALGSVGKTLGLGSLFGGSGATVSTAAQLGAGFESYMGASGIFASSGGTAAGAMGALGSLGPIAAAATALFMLAKGFKGETRSGGTYTYDPKNGTQFAHGPSGGQLAQDEVRTLISSTVESINKTLKAVGSELTVNSFIAGLETSEKGRGGVMAGGTLSNGVKFGQDGSGSNYEGTYYDKLKSMTLNGEQALKEFTTEMYSVVVEALQAVKEELPRSLREMVENVNAAALTQDAAKSLIDQINTIVTSVTGLREALAPLPQQFNVLRDLSFDATASLVKMAGGLDKLTAGINAYYENFFSATEKRFATADYIARTIRAGTGADVSAAQVLQYTRAQFRQLVESLDLNSEAGQKMYTTLMSVAGAFASITTTATAAGEAVVDLAALQQQASDAQQVLITAVTRESAAVSDAIPKWKNFGDSLRDLQRSLLFGDLSPLTPKEKYEQSAQVLADTYAKAMAGDETAMSQLAGVAQTFLEASREYNASGGNYQSDFTRVQNMLSAGISKADQQLSALNAQKAIMDQQLIELQGNKAATISVADAVKNLAMTVAALIAAGGDPSSVLPQGAIRDQVMSMIYTSPGGGTIYNDQMMYTITGRHMTLEQARASVNQEIQAGNARGVYYAVRDAGFTLSDLDRLMGWQAGYAANAALQLGLPVFAKGGAFTNGIVTRPTMFNMGLMGEAGDEGIFPLANVGGSLGVRAVTDRVMSDRMAAMHEEFRAMHADLVAGTRALIEASYDSNNRAAEHVVTGHGRSMERIQFQARNAREARPQ
jgi:TP901 family phage tail tape measure protein